MFPTKLVTLSSSPDGRSGSAIGVPPFGLPTNTIERTSIFEPSVSRASSRATSPPRE